MSAPIQVAMASGWFRLVGGRIRFMRVTRGPVDEWLRGEHGAALVSEARSRTAFAWIGRERAARRALWLRTADALHAASARALIDREADRYLALLASLAYTDVLPRLHVDLHRLVAVPRALADNSVFAGLLARFDESPALEAVDRRMRAFLAGRLVAEMDGAVAGARPSVSRPVAARDQWASVGLNGELAWTVPLSAEMPERRGHFHLFEFPRTRLGRQARRRIQGAIQELDAGIAALSRADRLDIIGRAAKAGVTV